MLDDLLENKQLYGTLMLWLIIGVFSSTLAMVFIPLHLLTLKNDHRFLIMFLGFWFILILSDSYQRPLAFAITAKPFVLIALSAIIVYESYDVPNYKFHQPFIVFFLIAAYCLWDSPIQFESAQKMVSYFLLLFTIPTIINHLLRHHKELFLKHIVLLVSLILLIGIVLKYLRPEIVIFNGERYSGVFGNPNGMGMFGFLFFCLLTIIVYYYPNLFTKTEKIIAYSVIVISLVWAGSRGGLLASILFYVGSLLFRKSPALGFIVIALLLIAYQLTISNLESIVKYLNLEAYFRLETLETGSGRNIAFDFAWKHIQNNFWLGKGFGFGEYLMQQNQDLFMKLGHIGNVHNSYLTIWLDTGLIGLIFFAIAWGYHFINAFKYSFFSAALFFAILLSTNVESWLAASLNPFTIQLVIMLTLLSNPLFVNNKPPQ